MHIVTLLSDFGLRDPFVATMKGVILSLNPDVKIVDISHLISPQDIFGGAFALKRAYAYFPLWTIHLAIVDPGVGTQRKALAVDAGGYVFLAPDNGILTYIFKLHPEFLAYEITAEHYYRKPVSSTFHGRDIFAPAAAWISKGVELPKLGPLVEKPVQLEIPAPIRVKESLIQATILAVDQFGNLITNLMMEDVPVYDASEPHPCKILAGQHEVTSFLRSYGEGRPGEPCIVPGSSGYLEIAVRNGSAASLLNMKRGSVVGVVIG